MGTPSSHGLEQHGLKPMQAVHWNLSPAELVEQAVRRGEGQLTQDGPLFLLRDLDTKLRRAVSLGPRDKAQQVLGIGGPDELGLQNLTALGEKKQAEALKEMSDELSQLSGA